MCLSQTYIYMSLLQVSLCLYLGLFWRIFWGVQLGFVVNTLALCAGVVCLSQYMHIYVSFAGLFMFVFGSLLTCFLGCAVGICGQHVGTVCVRHVFVTVHAYIFLFCRTLYFFCIWVSFDMFLEMHSRGLRPTRWHCVREWCVCHGTYIYMSLLRDSFWLYFGLIWHVFWGAQSGFAVNTLALCAGVMCLSRQLLVAYLCLPLVSEVCCSVLQCVVVYCSVLQCVAACCSVLQRVAVCYSVLYWVALCCNVLQCVGSCSWRTCACLSFLRCVAACCSVL